MMSKYVLTHQPNLVNLYALGRLRPPRQPLPLGEAAHHHLKAYPGAIGGQMIGIQHRNVPLMGNLAPPQIWHLTLTGKWHLTLTRKWHLTLTR
jgi:hypothetical protein